VKQLPINLQITGRGKHNFFNSDLSSGMYGPDDEGSTYVWNVGRQLFYTAVHPRRQIWTSYSPPWELEISQFLKLERMSTFSIHPFILRGVSETLLDTWQDPFGEWSARGRGLYRHRTTQNKNIREKPPCPQRDSNRDPRNKAAKNYALDRATTETGKHKY
jgi:hypothetical protein